MELPKFLLSSTGKGLAQRWSTFFEGAIPAIVFVSTLVPTWNILAADLNEFNGYVIAGISGAVAVWKAVGHIDGWIRRFAYKRQGLGKFA